ncbi:MAG: hypothetical protein ACKV0T_22395, partial [Planctomycetales bacterium]
MSPAALPATEGLSQRLLLHRERLQALHEQARARYISHAAGLQVATLICEQTERLIVAIFRESLAGLSSADEQLAADSVAVVAVGGTGRGGMAPYSDADLLFLRSNTAPAACDPCILQAVRDCWDVGLHPGSDKILTPDDALSSAVEEHTMATSLVEARLLWGSERMFELFREKFRRKVVRNRYARFFAECVAAREAERAQFGVSDRQLEPDVKRSSGGLRDVHLLRWIGYAAYGTPDIDLLRRCDALSKEDADRMTSAHEFLTRVRVDLHYAAGKAQEVLTRDEQLRLAELHGIPAVGSQRPVERFMQLYLEHATSIADITQRFVARHRPRPWRARLARFWFSHRNDEFIVSGGEIEARSAARETVCGSLEGMLKAYELAALYTVRLSPALTEDIRRSAGRLPRGIVSPAAAQSFLAILGATDNVGHQLRDMCTSGLLEVVLPEWTHARCLLQ